MHPKVPLPQVHLVVWSEQDSGFQVLAAYTTLWQAEVCCNALIAKAIKKDLSLRKYWADVIPGTNHQPPYEVISIKIGGPPRALHR